MQMRSEPFDTDVPFFPFPLRQAKDNDHYSTANHHMARPIHLDRQVAEVLRLADGATRLSGIVARLADRYPDAGGLETIRSRVVDVLRFMTERELVWWREVPLELVPVGPPSTVFWEITAACNLRCRHCVVSAGARQDGELPRERSLALAEELGDFGVEIVAFSGGEPLVHQDFFTLAEYVRSLGMAIQVATNGTLVTPEVAHRLKELDASVQVSLDGSRPEIHDYLRPGLAAFARSVEGIRALVAAGHQVTIATVLSTLNLDDIPNIVTLAKQLGVTGFRLIPFVPKGRGEQNRQMELPPAAVKKVTRYLHELRDKTTLSIAPLEFEEMLDGGVCSDPLVLNQHIGCSGAFDYATITPVGEVLPCHFFEGVRADGVKSASFRDVWCRSRFLNYFRHLTLADLHGACRACSWLPRCRGSCRAVNFAKGDLLGVSQACWIVQDQVKEQCAEMGPEA